MDKHDKLYEACDKLEEYSRYEGAELGGMWDSIAKLWVHFQDYISKELKEVLEQEILAQSQWIDDNCTIEEVEVTTTHKRKELRIHGDF